MSSSAVEFNEALPEAPLARVVKNALCIDGHLNQCLEDVMQSNSPDETFAHLTALAHRAVDAAFAAMRGPHLELVPVHEPKDGSEPRSAGKPNAPMDGSPPAGARDADADWVLVPRKVGAAVRTAWMDVYDEKGWTAIQAMWDAAIVAALAPKKDAKE